MNLATTPTSLNIGALERHLQRHPQDMPLKPLLEGIFSALEQADILGSLIRPKAYLDHAIAELQRPHTMSLDFTLEEQEVRRTITDLANRDPQGLRQMLLDRIADSFKAEAGNIDDVSAALFGREAERGVRLLQLLDRRYAVVVTNPPYMGSKNMDTPLKKYVEKYYPSGKSNLFATFILRCLELCQIRGRVAIVTINKWMFLTSYTELREGSQKFKGLLRETQIEVVCDLGSRAFALDNHLHDGVQIALFNIMNSVPTSHHKLVALRFIGPRAPEEKDNLMLRRPSNLINFVTQLELLKIEGAPLIYSLDESLFALLTQEKKLQNVANVRQGLATADDSRFIRYMWEIIPSSNRWVAFTKGGGYCKWFGQNWFHVDWEYVGARTKAFGKSVLRNVDAYFQPGWSYSLVSDGSIGFRRFDLLGCIGHKGPGVYSEDKSLVAIAQSHVLSFMLRVISPQLAFEVNTVMQAPLPEYEDEFLSTLAQISEAYKRFLISGIVTERTFVRITSEAEKYYIASLLHTIEGMIEQVVCQGYHLSEVPIQIIMNDTGVPAGWYPLVTGYEVQPALPSALDLPALPQELFDYLATHERINPDNQELNRIRANLRALYEAGPGAKNVEQEEAEETMEESEGMEEIPSGAHIPIPTETFLEELSVKLQLHPISVYWLFEELKAEGARCKPEELRLLEDRLSVLVLRLLGHRWPKQLESGEPVPVWTNGEGIMPLVAGTSKATAAEQVRSRLRAEDGELGVQQVEMLLAELTGLSLEEWLRRKFFARHVSQFKYRPVAWHLASLPVHSGKKRRSSSQRGPAFECLLYYHACAGDALARIRTQYIEPLLRAEHQRIEDAYLFTDDETSALAHERIQELEAFAEKLRLVEEQGFACAELDKLMDVEALDRWSGNGYVAPTSRDELRRNEQAWRVDINDGVRVNIVPLQLAGALASDVLKVADAKKALADRARWRADERRWVRDGKLPRCGWMEEQVTESQRWTEREPERAAGQIKLEQKRQALKNRRAEEVEA